MTKTKRFVAFTLALTFVFAVLFSVCFIIVKSEHDCSGEDCPTCCQITVCEYTLKSLCRVVTAFMLAAFMACFAFLLTVFTKNLSPNTSLIKLKVKLSN